MLCTQRLAHGFFKLHGSGRWRRRALTPIQYDWNHSARAQRENSTGQARGIFDTLRNADIGTKPETPHRKDVGSSSNMRVRDLEWARDPLQTFSMESKLDLWPLS